MLWLTAHYSRSCKWLSWPILTSTCTYNQICWDSLIPYQMGLNQNARMCGNTVGNMEPVQMTKKDWLGLQAFARHRVGTDTDGKWDVSEVQFSPYLSCVRSSLHEKGRGLLKHSLSFWESMSSLEVPPLPLKCEICLETCRLNFNWRDYLYRGVNCEFPACIYTSKSLAFNCLQKVNND